MILGMRNSIIGMAFHDLSDTKPVVLGATPGAIPGIDRNPHERFLFAPTFSEVFIQNWGVARALENSSPAPLSQQFTYGVVREGVTAENVLQVSAKFP